jgi:hypothetical protein
MLAFNISESIARYITLEVKGLVKNFKALNIKR